MAKLRLQGLAMPLSVYLSIHPSQAGTWPVCGSGATVSCRSMQTYSPPSAHVVRFHLGRLRVFFPLVCAAG